MERMIPIEKSELGTRKLLNSRKTNEGLKKFARAKLAYLQDLKAKGVKEVPLALKVPSSYRSRY